MTKTKTKMTLLSHINKCHIDEIKFCTSMYLWRKCEEDVTVVFTYEKMLLTKWIYHKENVQLVSSIIFNV